MMRNLCIIPARGGSKRIKKKNIRFFLGEPIISYSIKTAIKSKLFDTVMVSTDDSEIAKIALKYGAEIPFFRSEKASNDVASTSDVIEEVLKFYKDNGIQFDHVCCYYATAPLVTIEQLEKGLEKLSNDNINSVFPIIEFNYPIFRSLKIDQDDNVSLIWPEFINTRTQDIQRTYHDAGQWYWIKVRSFEKELKIISQKSYGLVLSNIEAQDIDTEIDWKLAELKYEIVQGIK